MTQYMLSVHHDPKVPTRRPRSMQKAFEQVDAFNAEMQAAGRLGVRRRARSTRTSPPSSAPPAATTVTTDGPFAETKEQLGGFWVIEAPDLDAALEWAAKALRRLHGPGRGPAVPGRAQA